MTENKRTPRSATTREKDARRKPWAPPSRLDAPPAPDGYVHRWIRVAMRGEEDKMNVHAKLREGWEPVRADEYPNYEAPVIDDVKSMFKLFGKLWILPVLFAIVTFTLLFTSDVSKFVPNFMM